MEYLQVSLTYMISYLTVLVEEFGAHYLEISNLQNYQDALANRMRILFTEVTEGKRKTLLPWRKRKISCVRRKKFSDSSMYLPR